jgi:hypothetical protein
MENIPVKRSLAISYQVMREKAPRHRYISVRWPLELNRAFSL